MVVKLEHILLNLMEIHKNGPLMGCNDGKTVIQVLKMDSYIGISRYYK